ncbi:ankyrin repeat and SOCS box protein 9-like isoform X3 [Ranitomeya variabilis]|uniref:ankyrin repeat and SOCS box protein 9-like isoform X3 n=1 Tax=Ranitomeya variabilis TaxID=490064 RepID=UPI004055EF53
MKASIKDFVSDWSLLHEASIHGRQGTLNKLINQGYSVNLITADHVTPLHEACLGGHPGCATLLLKHGAKVNIPNIDWKTPIFNACVSGNVSCVNLLLQQGASPHAACDVASPIHEACKRGYTECVESLLNAGVSVEKNINHLGSPLYVACENGKLETVKRLLELGASANVGKELDSPLHIAARNGNAELASLLIDYGGNMQSKNADGKRPSEIIPLHSTLHQLFLNREDSRLCLLACFLFSSYLTQWKINGHISCIFLLLLSNKLQPKMPSYKPLWDRNWLFPIVRSFS